MSSYSRCMGIRPYEPQCQNCERLPRSPKQEESESWMTPTMGRGECDKCRPTPGKAYREADARAILDEVEARR
jgi:hypothetical protein